jgi:hypothetical protein
VHVLKRLNGTYLGGKMEHIPIESALTVEHVMPQHWVEHWPLPDGSAGMATKELWSANEADPRAIATRRRNAALQTIGNLTILTQPLNSAVSNSPWIDKKPELLRHSLLPINQYFHNCTVWDEGTIEKRAEEMLGRAMKIWPRG